MSGTKFWTTATASLLIILFPAVTWAAECKRAQRVHKPCTGDLLPISLSGKGLTCLKTCKKEWQAKLTHANEVHAAEKKSLLIKSDAYKVRGDEFKTLLDKALAKPEQKYLLDTHAGWFGVGVAAGFGGAIAIALLMR